MTVNLKADICKRFLCQFVHRHPRQAPVVLIVFSFWNRDCRIVGERLIYNYQLRAACRVRAGGKLVGEWRSVKLQDCKLLVVLTIRDVVGISEITLVLVVPYRASFFPSALYSISATSWSVYSMPQTIPMDESSMTPKKTPKDSTRFAGVIQSSQTD